MPPLVWIAVAWMAGLVAARYWLVPAGVNPVPLILLGALCSGSFFLWRHDRTMRLWIACALAFLLAALRYQAALPDPDDPGLVRYFNDQGWVTVEGVVQAYPDVRDTRTNLRLRTDHIEVAGRRQEVHGDVLVRASRYPEYHYGDRLRVSGTLETPTAFQDFNYGDYLARKGIYSVLDGPKTQLLATGQGSPFWSAIFVLKDRARDALARLVPEPEASLLQGILLGIQGGIPADLADDYNATGTSHVIVISGSNITVVAALFAASFGRMLGKRRAYWFVVAGIALYVLLVGADAAVVRAGLMGGLYVTALHLGRRATAYVSLFASAILMTAVNPLALWDAGFQLSLAATLSLILFTPGIERLFERGLAHLMARDRVQTALRYLNDVLIVTLAAQILTIPLVAYQFGRLSLVAPLANLLILPVQPPIMIAGLAAALVALVPFLQPLARVIAWIPWLCAAYTNLIVRWMADWRGASLQVSQADTGHLFVYVTAAIAMAWLLHHQPRFVRRFWKWLIGHWSTAAILAVPAAAVVLIWLAVLQLPDGRLHVAFLDVGQGDAVFITTPEGRQILVDGGPSPAALTAALGRQMPFWDRSIDFLVMTHPDSDHITGLVGALDHYQVGAWLDNGLPGDDALYAECQDRLAEAGIPKYTVRAGHRLELGEGLTLEVLNPPAAPNVGIGGDDNDNSLVLRLLWGQASFLLTGDVEAEAEYALLQSGQSLTAGVLKVAHHGSGGSSTPGFLAAVAPRYAVISVGAENKFDHPDPAVLARLHDLGDVTLLRTDQAGTIEFVTDGRQLRIQTDRPVVSAPEP
jgi:competence protein ComEC